MAMEKWNKMTNQERFHKLVSAEATNTIERAKQRIAKRKAMKIDQEEFNRKAQHILDTVVKPQVEKYEQAKAMEKQREKSIFSIAYRMTPIEFGKEYCEAEFEKFNKTFKSE